MERSRIRAVQMDNLRGLLDTRRIDRIPNTRIRELCRAKKGLDEGIDEGVLKWFGHVDRMERNRIAKSLCRNVLVVSCSVDRLWKRWIKD